MNKSTILFSSTECFILNKRLLQQIGLESTIVLSEIIQTHEKNKTKIIKKKYHLNQLNEIAHNTTLSISKIKHAINKLYKVNQPFDFMEIISMRNKVNFFEKKVQDYKKATTKKKFSLNSSF